MEFKLQSPPPPTLTVIIDNIKMEYQTPKIYNYVPNWQSQILSKRSINLDSNLNLNGVRDFFDGISNGNIQFTAENCETIAKLAEESGFEEIHEKAVEFMSKFQRTIPELLQELIDEKKSGNQIIKDPAKEIYLSKHYNEILKYPEILQNVDIADHFKILKQALSYYKKDEFNYRGLISFVINLLERGCDRKYSALFSLLEFDDFDLSEIEKLCHCPNLDESILNFKIVNYISKLKENNEKIEQQKEKIKNLELQFDEFKRQNKLMVDEMTLKIIDLLSNQQKSIDEFKQSVDEKLVSIESKLKNEINQKEEEIKKQNKVLIDGQSSKIEQLFTNQQNSINDIKQQIDEKSELLKKELIEKIENNKNEINQKEEEIKKQNKELIDDQSSKIEQLLTNQQNSINDIKQQIDEKSELLKKELIEKIENNKTEINQKEEEIKKQNKKLIDDQSSKIEQLFTNQQSSINDIKLKNKQSVEAEISKLTTIQNNTNREINEIQTKLANLPSFIEENKGMKNELIRNKSDEKSRHDSQIQKINEIQNIQKIIEKQVDRIDMYFDRLDLKRNYLGNPFSGIISVLTENHGGNVNDKGVISITGNSYSGSYSFLVNYNYGSSHCFGDVQNSYICFDFKDHCISLSAYSIKSSSHSNPDYLKNWVVEGSNDENEWTELDSHSNEQALCSHNAIKTFQICKENRIKQPFKFIRIRMTGPSSRGVYRIEITNVEFFGKYYKR